MADSRVQSILEAWLKKHKFDGLYNGHDDCACEVAALAPCEGIRLYCAPGYKAPCPPDCGDHDWHIEPRRNRVKPPCRRRDGLVWTTLDGELLRKRRLAAGKTLTDTAKSARLSVSFVGDVEAGNRAPTDELLRVYGEMKETE